MTLADTPAGSTPPLDGGCTCRFLARRDALLER